MKWLLTVFLFSLPTFAKVDQVEMKDLMFKYIQAIQKVDEGTLKKITSEKYYRLLSKTDYQKQKQPTKEIQNNFDIEIKPLHTQQDAFYVGIKDKKSSSYGDYRYLVRKINDKFIIDDMHFMD